jgi:hypothetical protein
LLLDVVGRMEGIPMTIRKLAIAGVLALTTLAAGAVSAEAGYRYANGCSAPYGYNAGYVAYAPAPVYRARTYPAYGNRYYAPTRIYVPAPPMPVYAPYRVRQVAPQPGFFLGFHFGR